MFFCRIFLISKVLWDSTNMIFGRNFIDYLFWVLRLSGQFPYTWSKNSNNNIVKLSNNWKSYSILLLVFELLLSVSYLLIIHGNGEFSNMNLAVLQISTYIWIVSVNFLKINVYLRTKYLKYELRYLINIDSHLLEISVKECIAILTIVMFIIIKLYSTVIILKLDINRLSLLPIISFSSDIIFYATLILLYFITNMFGKHITWITHQAAVGEHFREKNTAAFLKFQIILVRIKKIKKLLLKFHRMYEYPVLVILFYIQLAYLQCIMHAGGIGSDVANYSFSVFLIIMIACQSYFLFNSQHLYERSVSNFHVLIRIKFNSDN